MRKQTLHLPTINKHTFSKAFVSERDLFLAHSLQMASDSIPSMAASPRVVVGVVGIGHVPGIVENWGKVTKEQIR